MLLGKECTSAQNVPLCGNHLVLTQAGGGHFKSRAANTPCFSFGAQRTMLYLLLMATQRKASWG